jgi:hypothetical protein
MPLLPDCDFLSLLLNQYGLTESAVLRSRPLESGMDYSAVDSMAFQLSLQLRDLEAHGFTLLFWDTRDISVLDIKDRAEKLYVLTNLAQQVPLDKKDKNKLVLVYPKVFPLPADLCAPEVLKMNALPFLTHRSASYYSLALVCLKLVNMPLEKLKGTKLFYFLERCLKISPRERVCYYL